MGSYSYLTLSPLVFYSNGQSVYLADGKRMGVDRYFSQLHVSLYQSKIQVIINLIFQSLKIKCFISNTAAIIEISFNLSQAGSKPLLWTFEGEGND